MLRKLGSTCLCSQSYGFSNTCAPVIIFKLKHHKTEIFTNSFKYFSARSIFLNILLSLWWDSSKQKTAYGETLDIDLWISFYHTMTLKDIINHDTYTFSFSLLPVYCDAFLRKWSLLPSPCLGIFLLWGLLRSKDRVQSTLLLFDGW